MKHFIISLIITMLCASASNANTTSLPLLAEYGNGVLNTLAWHPTEDIIAVGSGRGIWEYDTEFNIIAHYDIGYIRHLSWSDTGAYISMKTGYDRTVNECHIYDYPLDENNVPITLDDCSVLGWSGNNFFYSDSSLNNYIYDAEADTVRPLNQCSNSRNLVWSDDGTQVLAVSRYDIRLCSVETGDLLQEYNMPEDTIGNGNYFDGEAIWHDGRWIIIRHVPSDPDFGAYYSFEWDLETNTLIQQTQLRSTSWATGWVGINLLTDEDVMLLESLQEEHFQRLIWRTSTSSGNLLSDFEDIDVVAYRLNPEQTQLLIASQNGRLIRYDMPNNTVLADAYLHEPDATTLVWHPTDLRLAATSYDNSPRVYQYEDGSLSLDQRFTGAYRGHIGWSQTGDELWVEEHTYLYYSHTQHDVTCRRTTLDAQTYTEIDNGYCFHMVSDYFNYRQTSPDGLSFVAYLPEFHELDWGTIGTTLPEEYEMVYIRWSPNSEYVMIVMENHIGRFLMMMFNRHGELLFEDNITSPHMIWSPDSQYIAQILNVRTNPSNGRIVFHAIGDAPDISPLLFNDLNATVSHVTWSPDNQSIVLFSEDVRFFDVHTAEQLATIPVETWISNIAWHDNGTHLAISHRDGILQIWDASLLIERR